MNESLLILTARDVRSVLDGAERDVIAAVRAAYLAHGAGQSELPHSVFLRFPDRPRDRIIALPAYLGGAREIAGLKWIASFPGNVERGIERASATLVLNSLATGRPIAFMESAVISARRTAASAALAARALHAGERPRVALVGCGVIQLETLRFLVASFPQLTAVTVFDLSQARADAFRAQCAALWPQLDIHVARDAVAGRRGADIVSLATTALAPHIDSLDECAPGCVVLHVSLRDLSPELIRRADNVVDDVDHVCRAQTSVHLAEQQAGDRSFIRATLADILSGAAPARTDDRMVIFSPFGLGVLDLAVGQLVLDRARAGGTGLSLDSFF